MSAKKLRRKATPCKSAGASPSPLRGEPSTLASIARCTHLTSIIKIFKKITNQGWLLYLIFVIVFGDTPQAP
ncbi:hypothetical protein, partial [Lactococcus lactis]|uniref:hypothetical protein n=1 Tax=Lactococcus lactis TaxID=1358 RepID=UPI00288CA7FA